MSASIEALSAIGVSTQVTANNVANVNTDGFVPSRANYETGPEGEGVRVSSITTDSSVTPPTFDSVSLFSDASALEGAPGRSAEVAARFKESGGSESFVNLGDEMTQLITNQRAYQANISSLRAESETVGQLVSQLV